MVQALVATSCILTPHRCGLLAQVVEATVCACDRSCAKQSVLLRVGRHPREEVAEEVGYGHGETTQQGDVIVNEVYPGSMQHAPRCATQQGIGISYRLVSM